MANFLIAIDPDAARRRAFATAARPNMAPIEGLVAGECSCQDFQAVWLSGARASVTTHVDPDRAAVVWGRPIAEGSSQVIDAARLAAEWHAPNAPWPIFDGYYVGARYAATEGLVVGTDILGLFPVFWWSQGEVLLIGSSQELFKHHPLFRLELDLAGLTGILLMGYTVDGRTLMSGVRRLGPGCALAWRRGSTAREVRQYDPPVSTKYFSLPFSPAVELVNETQKRAVSRQIPSGLECGLTLSGGRDSRLLAGMMVDAGHNPSSLTYGNESDIEVQCATAVADVLHLTHRIEEMQLDQAEAFADLHARMLHCSTGFNLIEYWSCVATLRSLPPHFASAFIMDYIIGGSHVGWAYSASTGTASFDTLFARNNAYAVGADTVRRLLRPELFDGAIEAGIASLKNTYDSYDGFEAQRAWWFDLHHRVRFYTATFPWQLSFASWPILPTVDKTLFEVTGGLPPGILSERRVQDEILRKHFPRLAELPLDRNSDDTEPISPRLRHRVRSNVMGRLAPLTKRLSSQRRQGQERRIYYRIFDFNGPAWKAARRLAEPHRDKLYSLFDRNALDAALPPPDEDVAMADGIVEASGRKLLVGLCLWAGRHL